MSPRTPEPALRGRDSETFAVLDAEQFTSADVCAIVGINAKQLEHAVDPGRSILRLRSHGRQRTKGKRRLFCGEDVIKLTTLFQSNAIGFPQRFAATLADQVARRAVGLLSGLDGTPNLIIITYPMQNGDWALIPMHQNASEPPSLPTCVQIIEVDRLISETLQKLRAAAAEEPIPQFPIEEPKPESPGPDNDFYRVWDKDPEGRHVLVGLTVEETEFFNSAFDARLRGEGYDHEKLSAVQSKHYRAKEERDRAWFEEERRSKET